MGNVYLAAYSTGKKLAKDVCWAMSIVPSCSDACVTEIDGYGYLVECRCTKSETALGQLHSILKNDYHKVNWVLNDVSANDRSVYCVDKQAAYDAQRHWGDKYPVMACEECGELIQAISKLVRKDTPVRREAVVEEMGDVIIAVEILCKYFGIDPEDVQERIDYKMSLKHVDD